MAINLNEVTDLHNRRANVNVTSAWFKDRDIPYLAWPEDKLMLRIADLPVLIGITPRAAKNWDRSFVPSRRHVVHNNEQLRALIVTDHLYALTGIRDAYASAYYVTEYIFIEKGVS